MYSEYYMNIILYEYNTLFLYKIRLESLLCSYNYFRRNPTFKYISKTYFHRARFSKPLHYLIAIEWWLLVISLGTQEHMRIIDWFVKPWKQVITQKHWTFLKYLFQSILQEHEKQEHTASEHTCYIYHWWLFISGRKD